MKEATSRITYQCFLAVQAGLADLILSPPILAELRTVLLAKFRHTPAEAEDVIRVLRTTAELVEISGSLRAVPDDPDNLDIRHVVFAGRPRHVLDDDAAGLALHPPHAVQ